MALRPCLPLLCLVVLCSCGREAETEIAAGPYLLDVAPAEATVLWVTSEPADTTVECWTGESLPTTHIDERTTVHRVRLTGLPSDTAVHYRVGSGGAHSAVHSFRTAPREERPFTFVVFGDTGGAPERLAALAEATRAHDPAFVVHAGGYTAGEGGESAWRRQFFGPAGDLLASRALVPAPGPAAGGSATFARLFPTAGGTPWRRHRFLHVELFALDAREGIAVGDEQYRWLEGALRRSDAQWKIIVLHGVLFPGAGGRARADLRRALYPLLLRARADLVFAAGSAACARTAPIGSGDTPAHNALVSFTITATPDAGPEPRREPWLADAAARPGYLRVEVDDEQLTVQALDARGTTFDAVTLEKAGSLRD
ncbi:MAG: fibronectin type III domain-containing protein, partial [Planctomycetota bacterium]